MPPAQQTGIFPETRWSLILRLQSPEKGEAATTALNDLCRAYWQPLYVYLRRTGLDAEEAQDAVQGFLAHFLSKNGFERVGPGGGRFRSFLLVSLRNYLVSEARRQTAVKRGGNADFVALDAEQAEQVFQAQDVDSLSPEAAFDLRWAETVLTRGLQRLREEQRARGKEQSFDTLKSALTKDRGQDHGEAAKALGLAPAAVAVTLHRLRRRLRELVIEELSQTVGAHSDLQEELNYFLSIWSK
jgi:RNA polymerase sigma factor (sigma-70 family)